MQCYIVFVLLCIIPFTLIQASSRITILRFNNSNSKSELRQSSTDKLLAKYLLFRRRWFANTRNNDWLLSNSLVPDQPMIVVNTWPFTSATDAAWQCLTTSGGCHDNTESGSALQAVVAGCSAAEADPTILFVGFGTQPDEMGNVTLDAMVMDGDTMEVGAVAAMPDVRDASRVALEVLRSTRHTLLVGAAAADFAVERGFKRTDLRTNHSDRQWREWRAASCQPNFRRQSAWQPDPSTHCGPYVAKTLPALSEKQLKQFKSNEKLTNTINENNHDTIGMIAIDSKKKMAIGTSTSAAAFRVPGRVGDSAIPGAGGYVIGSVGGAVATGDGDIMMRYLLSFKAVELMRLGMPPERACQISLASVKQSAKWYGAIVALTNTGEYGAACVGFDNFQMSVRSAMTGNKTQIISITCAP